MSFPYRSTLRQSGDFPSIFLTSDDLQRNLYQRPRVSCGEDDLAQGGVDDGFEMALADALLFFVFNNLSFGGSSVTSDVKGYQPATPLAGLMFTSMAASSGSSSRLWTSTGPLIPPMMV